MPNLLKNFAKANSSAKPEWKGLYFNAIPLSEPPADGMIKMVPVGKFPVHPNGAHEIIPRHIEEMARNFDGSVKDLLFDYDHESLWGNTVAAGWSPKAEARPDGLYVQYPEFTPRALEAIKNREYRYFSPVYRLNALDKDGSEIGAKLISVALTNMPYMDNEIDHIGNSEINHNQEEENAMTLSPETLALLGINSEATQEDIEQAVKAQAQKVTSLTAEVDTLKQNAESQKTELEQRLANIEGRLNEQSKSEAEQLINSAIDDGKILPADKDVWLNAAQNDLSGTRQKLAERKKNSAMPQEMHAPQPEDKQDGKQPDLLQNAVDYMKAQGRAPLIRQAQA